MMLIFLTDGRTYLGPYDPDEASFAIPRGVRTLRENHAATDVYSVPATTEQEARRRFAAGEGRLSGAGPR